MNDPAITHATAMNSYGWGNRRNKCLLMAYENG